MVNVNRGIDDQFYRYKMPLIQAKVSLSPSCLRCPRATAAPSPACVARTTRRRAHARRPRWRRARAMTAALKSCSAAPLAFPAPSQLTSSCRTFVAAPAQVQGHGNGIHTAVPNMDMVARSLDRPPSYVTKYFGVELGSVTQIVDKDNKYIVNGRHDAETMQVCHWAGPCTRFQA